MTRILVGMALLITLVSVTGCAADIGNSEGVLYTLDEVKAETFAIQDAIGAEIPSEYLRGEPVRGETMTLIDRCSGENQWRWPGAWDVDIDPDLDTDQLLAKLEEQWNGKDGWIAEYSRESGRLSLLRGDGAWFDVGPTDGGSRLHIISNSACFQLDGPADPAEKY